MPTFKLTLQYDGTNYVGWQRQAAGTSIQAVVEDALAPLAGRAVTIQGAGRTDAGVHALGQVASVRLGTAIDAATLGRALNAVLPRDVRVAAVDEASDAFHARFSAIGKTYAYRIVHAPFVSPFLFKYAWHVAQTLDIPAMQAAAASLVGRHDFAAFQAAGSRVHSTERTIEALELEGPGASDDPLIVRVTGDGFLRHMVRNIAGTLVEVGARRWDAARAAEILASRSRARAGPTAPAHGLFLVSVQYPGTSSGVDA